VRTAIRTRRQELDVQALFQGVKRSDTGRAAGLAVAVIVANVLALVFTIVFARVLGASGYGSLAVLLSAYIIMMVPGSALQIAAARQVSHDIAVGSAVPGAGAHQWLVQLSVATGLVALVAIPLRAPIAAALNVDQVWAAAAVPVAAMLWIVLSVERGLLQGFQRYRTVAYSIVAEGGLRIFFALVLVAVGLDVTGAFLGSALALIALAVALQVPLSEVLPGRESLGPRLKALAAGSWIPVLALTLLLVLQEIHVIIVKHESSDDAAGSYAVAAVAAKAIVWVAIGLGMYLLPESARRGKTGVDARPILLRTLALIALVATPMVLIYAIAGEPLLRIVFGSDLTGASGALPWLGLAMSLLACTYLCVQYLLAMGRSRFIAILALAAFAEVALVIVIGDDLTRVALAVLGVQVACAAPMLLIALRGPSRVPPSDADDAERHALA
jgi:O-antigen/teichoic acid export membrane protein